MAIADRADLSVMASAGAVMVKASVQNAVVMFLSEELS